MQAKSARHGAMTHCSGSNKNFGKKRTSFSTSEVFIDEGEEKDDDEVKISCNDFSMRQRSSC